MMGRLDEPGRQPRALCITTAQSFSRWWSHDRVPLLMASSNQAAAIFWTMYWPAQARGDDHPLTRRPSWTSLSIHESIFLAICLSILKDWYLNSSAVNACIMPRRIVAALTTSVCPWLGLSLRTMVSMNRMISSVVGGVDRTLGFLSRIMLIRMDGKQLCHP